MKNGLIYAIGSHSLRSPISLLDDSDRVRDLNLNEFQNSFTIFVVQVSKNTHQKDWTKYEFVVQDLV